jgi:hypothetical protein
VQASKNKTHAQIMMQSEVLSHGYRDLTLIQQRLESRIS